MGPVRQNPIQRPVRSVHMCVHCTVHNCCTQYCTEQTSIFPLTLQTITTAPMMSMWGKGGGFLQCSDTLAWVMGRAIRLVKTCGTSSKFFSTTSAGRRPKGKWLSNNVQLENYS